MAVPYCDAAPKNAELNGLFQCQFQGSDQTTFVGGLKVGANGTIPFGQTTPLDPAGSCPANPSGPIADGSQLVDQVTSPGTVDDSGSSGNATVSAIDPASSPTPSSDSVTSPVATETATSCDSGSGDDDGDDSNDGESSDGGDDTITFTPTASDSATATATGSDDAAPTVADPTITASDDATATSEVPAATPSATAGSSSGDFQLQNGQDAQALNAQFTTLTANSTCNGMSFDFCLSFF